MYSHWKLEYKAPKEIRFFFILGTCQTSINVLTIPSYIVILIVPIPAVLQIKLLPIKTLHHFFISLWVINQSLLVHERSNPNQESIHLEDEQSLQSQIKHYQHQNMIHTQQH
eukprot:TRINITY_DN29601_c0_g1_i1.p2 TRINITY_DN29601_c0_g1~~TRINITY_DN29601_c0_g1_i1.p2  ORF type:complete len:112 (+),score=5.63 TRINITY_DN29601_c0_g1_i1:129-464(+)